MIHTIEYSKRAAAIMVAVIAAIGMAVAILTTHLVTFDHFGGVYGISIGTNNTYCSIEDKLPIVTCEHAR